MTRKPYAEARKSPMLKTCKVACPRCSGQGKRWVPFFVSFPEEYQSDIPEYELVHCDVCSGTGEVDYEPPRV